MRTSIGFLAVAGAVLASSFTGCVSTVSSGRSDFATKVKPVLEYFCIECHDSKSSGKYGGLNIKTGKVAMTTGHHAPVIVPGKPDESLLFKVLRLGHEHPLAMPPAPDKVSDDQLAAVRDWISAGAQWPAGPEGHLRLPE